MDAPQKIKFGSTFKAESQILHVNGEADEVRDDAWEAPDVFTVRYGADWYYAPLKTVSEDSPSKICHYLVRDDVGHDGWGGIKIFRNIEWLNDDLPNVIQTHDDVPSW